jgi:hypothetical protein
VDQAGVYDTIVIPENAGADGYWVRVDNNTLQLFIKDNGRYDLDATLGQITDPIVLAQVVGAATNARPIPSLSILGVLLLSMLLSVFASRRLNGG